MLSDLEKEGAKQLLANLPQAECLKLAKTVTNDLIAVTSKAEAISAIVSFTESPAELLKRKKVNRSLLFTYLANESIAVNPKAEKHVFSQKILELWRSNPVPLADLMQIDDVPDIVPSAPTSLMAMASAKLQSVAQRNNPQNNPPDLIQHHGAAAVAATAHHPPVGSFIPPNSVHPTAQCSAAEADQGHPMGGQQDLELAKAFICWFYPLLNNVEQGSGFGPNHFFSVSMLKLAHGAMGADANFEQHEGSEAVAGRLASVIVDKRVKFCPNVDDGQGGFMGFSSSIGLRKVKVCGTLHSTEDVVGVFEQEFGLVRDPENDFNFRIKYTNLKLIAGQPARQPTLELTQGLMELPPSEPVI